MPYDHPVVGIKQAKTSISQLDKRYANAAVFLWGADETEVCGDPRIGTERCEDICRLVLRAVSAYDDILDMIVDGRKPFWNRTDMFAHPFEQRQDFCLTILNPTYQLPGQIPKFKVAVDISQQLQIEGHPDLRDAQIHSTANRGGSGNDKPRNTNRHGDHQGHYCDWSRSPFHFALSEAIPCCWKCPCLINLTCNIVTMPFNNCYKATQLSESTQ